MYFIIDHELDLCNCGVVTPASVFGFLDAFLDVLNEPNATQVRKDAFIFMLLTALPWCGKALNAQDSHNLERIMNTIDGYIRNRDKTHMKILRVWRSDKPHLQEDMIDSIWKQIVKMSNNI